MAQPARAAITGDSWTAEIASGGYRVLVYGDAPETLAMAARALVQPASRLAYWELELQGYEGDAEVWFLGPRLRDRLHV